MTTTTRPSYAPRTRGGLLISCLGFAALAASAAVPALAAAVGPVMGVGFVVAIMVIVSVPRLIRPEPTWSRAALPRTFATAVFIGSATVALIALTVRMGNDSPAWGYAAAGVIIGEAVAVALVAPEVARRDRS